MTEIRSYRRVFDLERRVYSVDHLRLNPTGIPVRGIVYLLALTCCVLVLSALPVLGSLLDIAPWYLRDVGLPAALATVLGLVRIDGRTFHLAAGAFLRRRLRSRTVSNLTSRSCVGRRWQPTDLLLLPDGSDGNFRRLRYEGPGAVLVLREHRREGVQEGGRVGRGVRGATVRLAPVEGNRALEQGTIIALAPKALLDVTAGRLSPR
jgi:hypothetical protein